MKCELCPATVADNKWAAIRAHEDGWFFSRDGLRAFCPDHLPEWVPAWRRHHAEKKRHGNA